MLAYQKKNTVVLNEDVIFNYSTREHGLYLKVSWINNYFEKVHGANVSMANEFMNRLVNHCFLSTV